MESNLSILSFCGICLRCGILETEPVMPSILIKYLTDTMLIKHRQQLDFDGSLKCKASAYG